MHTKGKTNYTLEYITLIQIKICHVTIGDLVMLTEFNSKTNIKITGKRVNMSLENKIFKYDQKE